MSIEDRVRRHMDAPADEAIVTLSTGIVRLLADLSDEQRREVLSVVASFYCLGCGHAEREGYYCQCMNDE